MFTIVVNHNNNNFDVVGPLDNRYLPEILYRAGTLQGLKLSKVNFCEEQDNTSYQHVELCVNDDDYLHHWTINQRKLINEYIAPDYPQTDHVISIDVLQTVFG